MRATIALCTAFLAAAIAPALAQPPAAAPAHAVAQAAPAAPSDRGVTLPDGTVQYVFGATRNALVSCKPLFICDIALSNDETILNLAIGDSVRWIIASGQSGPAGDTPHVFVKPAETSLQTNLVITTTKRVYYLLLQSTPLGQTPRVSFSYPLEDAQREADREAAASRLADEAAADRALTLPLVPPEQLDTRYRTVGDKSFAPDRVYNDGVHTYMEYKTLPNDLPVILAIASDGSDQIVNFRLAGNTFIIDSLHSGYDLVLDAGTGKHGRGERRVHIRHL